MMGMNFPNAPTEGQKYIAPGGPTYTFTAGIWTLGASGGGSAIAVSDAAPGSPQASSLWWESDTGGLFLYYDDGNTSQFVQVNGSRDAFNPVRLNPQVISQNVSVPTGYNGMSAGPVSIASGVTVDVASGSTWVIV